MTADLSKRIADMMYDAGLYERAIEAYRTVLATDPSRRDVVEKIADYYIKQGDTSLEKDRLQQAYESYALAAKTNPLHPGAEGKRLQVERMIADRDARLESMRGQIEEAGKLQTQAEQLAMQQKPVDAIAVLKQAQQLYEGVNDEFAVEYEAASVGLTNISGRLRELKNELIQNAQSLSGSGTTFDAKKLASNAKALDEQALESLVNNQLDTALGKAKTKYQGALEIKP
jgi:tetratricopeptide (TPR) repeat protein